MSGQSYVANNGMSQVNAQGREANDGTAKIGSQQERDSATKESKMKQDPLFVEENEQPVEVKFFVKELIDKLIP